MSWIVLSVMAAAFQTLRFTLQKHLSMGALSAGGATLARFVYTAPFVTLLALVYLLWLGEGLPSVGPRFVLYVLSGGVTQILATWCVVAIFASRNFAVGITFKKTEVMLTALVGCVVLGDRVSLGGMGAIGLGLVGVLVLSDLAGGTGGLLRRAMNPAAGLGLLSGILFACSAVAYRGATLEVGAADPLLRALVTMPCVTIFQAFALGGYLRWREAGEISRVLASWRTSVWMGLAGMGGSICWFTAFAMMNAAYIFAVGQVEVIFSIMVSVWFFGEVITRREWVGMGLISLSVLGLVWLS